MRDAHHILVTGAGGFIGHHLVKRLKADGHWVRGVDLKYPEYETSPADEFESLDLRRLDDCLIATRGASKRSITWQLIWGASVISRRFTPPSPVTIS